MILNKAEDCTKEILKAKYNFILTMSNTCNDPWAAILNHLLCNKKIIVVSPSFVDGNFVSNFSIIANLFNNFICFNVHANKNCKCPTFFFKQNKQ